MVQEIIQIFRREFLHSPLFIRVWRVTMGTKRKFTVQVFLVIISILVNISLKYFKISIEGKSFFLQNPGNQKRFILMNLHILKKNSFKLKKNSGFLFFLSPMRRYPIPMYLSTGNYGMFLLSNQFSLKIRCNRNF